MPDIKEDILHHWLNKDVEIKEGDNNPEEFTSRKTFESAKKKPRKSSQARQVLGRSRAVVDDLQWLRNSHRSAVVGRKGMCASSQPLASAVGVRILQAGGTAADAAVAMAAALNVLEPCSTGLGGDAFALYYHAETRKVHCLQGNGSSPAALTLEYLEAQGYGAEEQGLKGLDPFSALCVTVPGAAMLWEDLLERHGRLKLLDALQPAIDLAREGFPVAPMTARQWARSFVQGEEAQRVLFRNGRAPEPGEVLTNPDLADTLALLGNKGARAGFYEGRVALALVSAVRDLGGLLDLPDLAAHRTGFEPPLSVVYRGIRVFQAPPPTHGVALLEALGLLNLLEPLHPSSSSSSSGPASEESEQQVHLAVECMRLAYADALQFVCDPRCSEAALGLLEDEYLSRRALQVDPAAASEVRSGGDPAPFAAGETAYFCCVDGDGNACSFINSNYMGFGTGIMPRGTGFTLQNRGHNFSLHRGHPNQVGPSKKPYHTIIPGLALHEDDQQLLAVLGCMGGFMQPMGQLQLLRNLTLRNLDPQQALDAPRWYLAGAGRGAGWEGLRFSSLLLEDGYGEGLATFSEPQETEEGHEGPRAKRGRKRLSRPGMDHGLVQGAEEMELAGEQLQQLQLPLSGPAEIPIPVPRGTSSGGDFASRLRARGHDVGELVVGSERAVFGRGQIIVRDRETGVLWGGSDPRCDGCAMPVV